MNKTIILDQQRNASMGKWVTLFRSEVRRKFQLTKRLEKAVLKSSDRRVENSRKGGSAYFLRSQMYDREEENKNRSDL